MVIGGVISSECVRCVNLRELNALMIRCGSDGRRACRPTPPGKSRVTIAQDNLDADGPRARPSIYSASKGVVDLSYVGSSTSQNMCNQKMPQADCFHGQKRELSECLVLSVTV